MEEARAKKEDALLLKEQMGEDFVPFVYELTYEQTYSIWGYLSFTNHKYVNVGGVHPTKTMDSRTYSTSMEVELSVSDIIEERMLDTSLVKYVTNLFVDKMKEIDPEGAEIYTFDYVKECLAYVQFYLTPNSLVLYLNQGEATPYALGVISVEIPYEPGNFGIDTRYNYIDEYLYEREYDDGYEWKIIDYTEDKLVVTKVDTDYPPERIYSELYPVGYTQFTAKGIKKGNASLVMAHVKKGEGLESAIQIYISKFYVDENNKLTLISEDEGMYLMSK